jgi:preprotein translocase subunit SecB
MKNAPLSLDQSYPTLINVVSDPEGSCNGGYDVECDIQVAQSANNERRWRVQLGVTFKAKGAAVAAHRGEVTYVGIFTVVDEFPLEKMYRLIGVDAPSILYSSIRELVALLTGRSSTRTVLLPTVSFIQNVVEPPQAPDQTKGVRSLKKSKDTRGVGGKKSTGRGRRKLRLAATR